MYTKCIKIKKFVQCLLIFFHLYSCSGARTYNACERGSCLPGTGNLLIGRENRLTASSTCGLRSQEKFCIVTSLDEKKSCFWCDSRPTSKDHRYTHKIENVVSKLPSGNKPNWWQSQNGVENVSIQLDLEAEFYFTYLYMKFKTFRPAAMLVERSYDYGQTWKAYGYFAADCNNSFPWVPKGRQRNLTIPYCTEQYSLVTPITDGEVILRILPPTLENTLIDPYSSEIQNLVKITNLRINFTKLHTLGDDLLDNRVDLQEKYYYAIWEMVVGGSCSCYGHANRCVPQEGVASKPNMVHGKCECTHFTKGLNCEKCEDLYNDLEWLPAIGKQTNTCKRCNCNNHATSCHFDRMVFETTGRVSGGMCDNCQHNTMGRNCEQCKHFYYQDPNRDFSDPDVCIECDCDPAGSIDDGICDSRTDAANDLLSGRCHCKVNIEGRRCDSCKNGFWNFTDTNPLGCQACSCSIFGTYENQGCNKETGECTCKRNVVGRDCNQCIPKYWGLGESLEGCKPCDCDPGGSVDDYCDVISGQCQCRYNITGRTCNMPDQAYFIKSLDFMVHEAELARCKGTCATDIRAPYPTENTWTGPGFIRVYPGTSLEFPIDHINADLDYEIIVRYEPQAPYKWNRVRVSLERPDEINPRGACADKVISGDTREISLESDSYNILITPPYCLEAGKNYTVRLEFLRIDGDQDVPTASILIDSVVLVPHIESIPFMHGSPQAEQKRREFEYNRCADAIYSVIKVNLSEVCKAYHFSIGSFVHGGGFPCECDSTGSYSILCDDVGGYCHCKPNVVGRMCSRCAPGTYGFGPEGCKACDCHSSGALDNFCDVYSGQCKCRAQTYGRSCDQCQPGYWNYPNCQRCICHGHADVCDPYTGTCNSCKNFTEGNRCDRCVEGFYGDPRIGVDIPCRMCPCPGTIESGHSYAPRCVLDPRTQDVVCECEVAYAGSRCETCAENYHGNPEVIGGRCAQCNCNNNIDISRPGNCDPKSGRCLQCLYNTEGVNCEVCKSGYYGDALRQTCRECVCDILGTDFKQGPCDRFTGNCPCWPNVTGISCNECIKNHWKIASGSGCEHCACDPIGSESEQCNQFDGQCVCRPGFGGRRCDQCQTNYWGNPNVECYPCECNPEGSATMQCNQTTGHCICMIGIGGAKCDQCARGYLGSMPNCVPCGECFDNWDAILNDLKGQTNTLIDKASEIMKTGASGSYTKEFETMEKTLEDVKQRLMNTTASSLQLQEFDKLITDIRSGITRPESMNDVNTQTEDITQRIRLAVIALSDLKAKTSSINATAQSLKENATKLQEGNVEGALNLTHEAYDQAKNIKQKNIETENIVAEARRSCKKTEALIGRVSTQFTQGLVDNDENLHKLAEYVNELETKIPSLNQQVCDNGGNPCDDLCGGAGCGFCGGLSCENGALTKAENALKFAKDAEKSVLEKETKAGELYRGISQARSEAKNALNVSQIAQYKAEVAKNESELALNQTKDMAEKLEKFINSSGKTPAEIRKIASETMNKTIKLQPEKITELAQKINDTVSSLTNIDAIIRDTENDLSTAKTTKMDAENTKAGAKNILQLTEKVSAILNQAESSQKLADLAIQMANENISSARKDLAKISEQSSKAQQNINDTTQQFANVEEQFKAVQKQFLENNAGAKTVEDELKMVAKDVDETQNKTLELTLKYQGTVARLEKQVSNSSEAHKNAPTLLEKATQLSANTTTKLKELMEFEEHFSKQEKDLESIKNSINQLMVKMQRNFDDIRIKSEHYQNCV